MLLNSEKSDNSSIHEINEKVKTRASVIYFGSEIEEESLNESKIHLGRLEDQFKLYEKEFEVAIQVLSDIIGHKENNKNYELCDKYRKLAKLNSKLNRKPVAFDNYLKSVTTLLEIISESKGDVQVLCSVISLWTYEMSLLAGSRKELIDARTFIQLLQDFYNRYLDNLEEEELLNDSEIE